MPDDTVNLDLDWYADRILAAQDVRHGPLRYRHDGLEPIDPLVVAAVLHAMADHTLITRLLREVVDQQALCPPGDPNRPASAALSLGRWFHRVADVIEMGTPLPSEPRE